MRNSFCPICRRETQVGLQLRFGEKMGLPAEVQLRHCRGDNFLFVANGCQSDYDRYYASVVNDSYHQEVSAGAIRSPICKLQNDRLVEALDGFFTTPRNVLDFGCGEGGLLLELASNFPSSAFFGFEPGPAARTAAHNAKILGLTNLSLTDVGGPYDMLIASHVMEHVLDLDLLSLFHSSLAEGGLLYIEVPDPLAYADHERLEFLYYFDRLHVNHFTPQSLSRLVAGYGFGYLRHYSYAFPYRDGGRYPALGMLFRKGGPDIPIESPSILDCANHYISQEVKRATVLANLLDEFEGVLIWGTGDNFHRSAANGGPLSSLRNMVLLDRRSHEVMVQGRTYTTTDPQVGIRRHPWPVVVTVSEARREIGRQIAEIDPDRRIFFI